VGVRGSQERCGWRHSTKFGKDVNRDTYSVGDHKISDGGEQYYETISNPLDQRDF
jgi:hypothetical protein